MVAVALNWLPEYWVLRFCSVDVRSFQELDLGSDPLSLLLSLRHAHKNTVMEVKWNLNGNWLLTASRDHLCKLFDIRNLKEELQVFRGHKKEATGEAEEPAFLFWSFCSSSCVSTPSFVPSCGLASCPRRSVC